MSTIVQMIIIGIILATVLAIADIGLKRIGKPIPEWLVQILWILFAAWVVITAIRFAAGL